jgi:hypothetical protein
MSLPRSQQFPDPVRSNLVEVRRGLLRLHKALIDAERASFEAERGQMSNTQLLQALLEEPHFAWLRPFSGLIVEIDEALASREPMAAPTARAYVERVRALVDLSQGQSYELARLDEVRTRFPEVLLLHVELTSRIATALA